MAKTILEIFEKYTPSARERALLDTAANISLRADEALRMAEIRADFRACRQKGTVRGLLQKHGWQINNADVTIMAQRPKLAPYIEQMAANIAREMRIERSAVNVKATTTEKLGFVGRGEGMASEAVVSIIRG